MQSPNHAVVSLFVSNLHLRQILKSTMQGSYPFVAKIRVPQEVKKPNNFWKCPMLSSKAGIEASNTKFTF